MTREKYIENRNNGEWNIKFIYEFYKENVENALVNEEQFTQILRILNIQGISTQDLLESVIKQLDRKYEIVTLRNKEGEIIKYY